MSGEPCYSIVRKPKGFEVANEITLRRRIEGDNLEKCEASVEELLQCLMDGEKFPTNLMMPVINRYQMNRFANGQTGNKDKRIKKLLYILWECLPKRSPDGKFLDKMVMVCGAFDKDLKHPNQYVCGAVLRTLSKTREPEVIRELVHSIEKCLEWSHAYQRKNAVLAIAKIYKNFPDLNPTAPKLIAEYLQKENDDECKRAALQALSEIDPEEAKPYLSSCNLHDIHCMNASIQLLFVEIIQKLFKKGDPSAESYIAILSSLIKQSSSPSVRYQAASTLMRFTRDPESVKIVATCLIDICAKESDNNVKLIALDSLMKLRTSVRGAERVLRNSIMDILFILQSATDYEVQVKILKLAFTLLSPLNASDIISALKLEIERNATNTEKSAYRELLINTIRGLAAKYPNAIIESGVLDTLFDLLTTNVPGSSGSWCDWVLSAIKVFLSNSPAYRPIIVKKIQDCFNMIKDSSSAHVGLIQILGDFSETKEQIEQSYRVLKESLGELPIVASELRKREQREENASAGDEANNNEAKTRGSTANGDVDMVTKGMRRLVTADGSYATQSAINCQSTQQVSDDEQTPLRNYYLKNRFQTASVLCFALLKMACRYQKITSSKSDCDKMIARFMFILASILNLGHSALANSEGETIHINNDHSENLLRGVKILQTLAEDSESDTSKLLKNIVTDELRSHFSLAVKNSEEHNLTPAALVTKAKSSRFDDAIPISLLASRDDDMTIQLDELQDEDVDTSHISMPDVFGEIPLTGTADAIYAYCEFDVNKYDVVLKIYLENRAKITLENVTLELAARGDSTSNFIDRPEPVALAPRSRTCISSSIKVVSAENRRLFGSIAYEETGRADVSKDRERVIVLNDISVNITDYIKPAPISSDAFRELWRDCEWENKVVVKTKLTNLKEYLTQLVIATNMRCVTSESRLAGECSFLSANLFARSSFGEQALVNVSIEKESAQSIVTGCVKIRSRSQGMALSLGEKITNSQLSSR